MIGGQRNATKFTYSTLIVIIFKGGHKNQFFMSPFLVRKLLTIKHFYYNRLTFFRTFALAMMKQVLRERSSYNIGVGQTSESNKHINNREVML